MASKFNAAVIDNEKHQVSVVGGVPFRLKKITGTRFSKVIDCNHWSTPFQAWCEIMKVAEPPFEGNKYTAAGQAIEPKLIDFCKSIVSPYIQMPEDYYINGKPSSFDFFDDEVYGGMWDALAFDSANVTDEVDALPIAVIEAKTTSRPQDWENGVPENYKAQGLLYAYLLGVNDVYFPVAFLTPDDYDKPENFECDETNTRVYHHTINDPVGNFENIAAAVEYANEWYATHVVENFSPRFNERQDREYLDIIKTVDIADVDVLPDDLGSLCEALYEADKVIDELTKSSGLADWQEKRKKINSAIQAQVKGLLSTEEGKNILETDHYTFKVGETRKADYKKMEEDGVYEDYVIIGSRITTTPRKVV